MDRRSQPSAPDVSPAAANDITVITQHRFQDPSRLLPPCKSFQCGEMVEEGEVGSVTFYCTWTVTTTTATGDGAPDGKNASSAPAACRSTKQSLLFSCRDRSVGVLLQEEHDKDDVNNEEEEEEEAPPVDEFFFDKGYTLAGRTGFQVWAGTRILLESLIISTTPVVEEHRLSYWQRCIREGAKVLELGAGVGVVGMSLAAAGAQVLLTDLKTLVDHSISPNLARNENSDSSSSSISSSSSSSPDPPSWLRELSSRLPSSDDDEDEDDAPNGAPARVGCGWAAATPLDWTVPLESQLSVERSQLLCQEVDVIVASDCVWLVSMLDALLDTVERVFHQATAASSSSGPGRRRPPPAFLMSFQRRNSGTASNNEVHTAAASTCTSTNGAMFAMFATVPGVVAAVQNRGWNIECLAWRPIVDVADGSWKEVYVFEITAP